MSYKSGSVYGLLERLGCSPKVPRARHEKADVGAQESVEKGGFSCALAGAGVSSDTAFGFADEMRVGLRGMVRRVWGRRGVKVHQRVQMVYKWTYLFLVVDVRRGRLLWSWIDSMRSAAIAAGVDGLKQSLGHRSAGVGWSAWSPGRDGTECWTGNHHPAAIQS